MSSHPTAVRLRQHSCYSGTAAPDSYQQRPRSWADQQSMLSYKEEECVSGHMAAHFLSQVWIAYKIPLHGNLIFVLAAGPGSDLVRWRSGAVLPHAWTAWRKTTPDSVGFENNPAETKASHQEVTALLCLSQTGELPPSWIPKEERVTQLHTISLSFLHRWTDSHTHTPKCCHPQRASAVRHETHHDPSAFAETFKKKYLCRCHFRATDEHLCHEGISLPENKVQKIKDGPKMGFQRHSEIVWL